MLLEFSSKMEPMFMQETNRKKHHFMQLPWKVIAENLNLEHFRTISIHSHHRLCKCRQVPHRKCYWRQCHRNQRKDSASLRCTKRYLPEILARVQVKRILSCGYIFTLDHMNVVELLIENNANINAKDVNGTTPLHTASENGNYPYAHSVLNNLLIH